MDYGFPNSNFDSNWHSDFDKRRKEFDNEFNKHKTEFDHDFDTAKRVFFIFFGIVVAVIVCGFIFIIFNICYFLIKGKTYLQYRREYQFGTIIPPPPPLINSRKYSFNSLFMFAYIFFRRIFVNILHIAYRITFSANKRIAYRAKNIYGEKLIYEECAKPAVSAKLRYINETVRLKSKW